MCICVEPQLEAHNRVRQLQFVTIGLGLLDEYWVFLLFLKRSSRVTVYLQLVCTEDIIFAISMHMWHLSLSI